MDRRYPTGTFTFNPNPTAESRRASIEAIEQLPAELKAAIAGVDVDTPYRDGGWTIRQVVHHMADSHMNAFGRFRLALTEDRPTIKLYDETEWAKLADSKLDPALSIQILDALHRRWTVMLNAMQPADFSREAVHPEHGPVPVDWFLQLYAWHGRHHVGHIKLVGV